jgi:single-strand DNA-binding protein
MSEQLSITGTILEIFPTQEISDKFQKREFAIGDSSGMYPQDIGLEFQQDKCTFLDDFKVGEVVKVDYNLAGRMWTNPHGVNKYFNTLKAWRIERVSTPQQPVAQVTQMPAPTVGDKKEDDLPF